MKLALRIYIDPKTGKVIPLPVYEPGGPLPLIEPPTDKPADTGPPPPKPKPS